MGSIADALRQAQEEREALRAKRAREAEPGGAAGAGASAGGFAAALEAARAPAASPTATAPRAPAAGTAREEVPGVEGRVIDLDQLSASFVAWHDKGAVVSEQYRSLRTRLMNLNEGAQSLAIAVTSSIAGEGKTTTTLNLGLSLSELQHLRVLVVDADLRRRSLSVHLGLRDAPGVGEILRGDVEWTDTVYATTVPRLHVLPAGHLAEQNAAEVLGAQSVERLMTALRRRYDYILVDLPPANTVADASILGSLCDGAILVVRMHRTPEPVAKQAMRLLESSNVHVIGCLLVGQRRWKAPWLHEYGGQSYYYGSREY